MKLGKLTSGAVLSLALVGALFAASLGARSWDYARVKLKQVRTIVEQLLVSQSDRMNMLEVQLADARAARDELANQTAEVENQERQLKQEVATYAAVVKRQMEAIAELPLPESQLQLGDRSFTRRQLEQERATLIRRGESLNKQAALKAAEREGLRAEWEKQDAAILEIETRLHELQPMLNEQAQREEVDFRNSGIARATVTAHELEVNLLHSQSERPIPFELTASQAILAELNRQAASRK